MPKTKVEDKSAKKKTKVEDLNREKFARALADARSRHPHLSEGLELAYPTLVDLWLEEFPTQPLQEASASAYRHFLLSSLILIDRGEHTHAAVIEFTKCLGGILGRPGIRKVAVTAALTYRI